MGKGSNRRPTLTSRDEESIRWDLLQGKITLRQFNGRMKNIKKVRNRR